MVVMAMPIVAFSAGSAVLDAAPNGLIGPVRGEDSLFRHHKAASFWLEASGLKSFIETTGTNCAIPRSASPTKPTTTIQRNGQMLGQGVPMALSP
jgi:hypothetical protein